MSGLDRKTGYFHLNESTARRWIDHRSSGFVIPIGPTHEKFDVQRSLLDVIAAWLSDQGLKVLDVRTDRRHHSPVEIVVDEPQSAIWEALSGKPSAAPGTFPDWERNG